jgi:hypothetical protein
MFQQRLPKLGLNKIKNIQKSGADVLEKTKICQNLQHVLTRFTKTCSRCTGKKLIIPKEPNPKRVEFPSVLSFIK